MLTVITTPLTTTCKMGEPRRVGSSHMVDHSPRILPIIRIDNNFHHVLSGLTVTLVEDTAVIRDCMGVIKIVVALSTPSSRLLESLCNTRLHHLETMAIVSFLISNLTPIMVMMTVSTFLGMMT